ncbi:MAG: hypothetical protein QM800_04275 [Paludibacter sp.]
MKTLSILLSSNGAEGAFYAALSALIIGGIMSFASQKKEKKVDEKVVKSYDDLIKIVNNLSHLTDSIKTTIKRTELEIESIILFSSIIYANLVYRCDKKIDPEDIAMALIITLKKHLQSKNYILVSNNEIENLVDNRLDMYLQEIHAFFKDKNFSFPKTTNAFFYTPLRANLDDYHGFENNYINENFQSWINETEKPLREWLESYIKI